MTWPLIAERHVEDGEQLAHDGDDGGLGEPAGVAQALVGGAGGGVVPDGGEGRHVQDVADFVEGVLWTLPWVQSSVTPLPPPAPRC